MLLEVLKRSNARQQIPVRITPEEAKAILEERNYRNVRKISKTKVDQYAQMQTNGDWGSFIGEPIAFHKDGSLLNGQHRLMACIKSGVPLSVMVLISCEDQDEECFDQGYSRSAYNGTSYNRKQQSIYNAIRAYGSENNSVFCYKRTMPRELNRGMNRFGESINFALNLEFYSAKPNDAPFLGVIARAHFAGENPDELKQFVGSLRGQMATEDREKNKTIITAIRTLNDFKPGNGAQNLERTKRLEYILRKYLDGQTVKRVLPSRTNRWLVSV